MSDYFFNDGGGVEGEQFIGRKSYLEKITSYASKKRCEHLSVYGLPHVGKTSLLKEWKRIVENEYEGVVGKKNTFIVFETVTLESESGEYGFADFITSLLKNIAAELIIDSMEDDEKLSRAFELNDEIDELAYETNYDDTDDEDDIYLSSKESVLLNKLKEVVYNINNDEKHTRVVLLLDEYERSGQRWNKCQYNSFMKFLLDDSLDVFCVTASRPHISYVCKKYDVKLSPFVPLLLEGFSDDDMDEYIRRVNCTREENGLDLSVASIDKDEIKKQLVYYCGRNPYLLCNLIVKENGKGKSFLNTEDKMPEELYNEHFDLFATFFHEVAEFMLYEEERMLNSFSHIIKCYFGTSEDYKDIINDYIEYGYIEKISQNSRYAYIDERHTHTYVFYAKDDYKKEQGEKIYYYTLSQAFLDYLYVNYVDEIEDVGDLLTGLVLSIRDITKYELKKIYGSKWNEEILKRLFSPIDEETSGYSFLRKGTWGKASYEELPENYKIFIDGHKDELISVSPSSHKFAYVEMTENKKSDMPVLDAISIVDNILILEKYRNVTAPYFSIKDDESFDEVIKLFGKVRDARNKISHFSRDGLKPQKKEEVILICRKMIRGIYKYWGNVKEVKM